MAEADMDLYADDLEGDFGQEDYGAEGVDLYDDVIAPTGVPEATNGGPGGPPIGDPAQANHFPPGMRRFQLYVGNLTWWTTDQDISNAVKQVGVKDFMEVKFFENRQNGQSKGFCTIFLGSPQSMRICMEGLPKLNLHGHNPVVTYTSKEALAQFESQSKTRPPPPPNPQQQVRMPHMQPRMGPPPMGRGRMPPPGMQGGPRGMPGPQQPPPYWANGPRQGMPPRPPHQGQPPRPPMQPMDQRGPPPRPDWNRPPGMPQQFPPQMPMHQPPPGPRVPPPPNITPQNPNPHVNPAFFPQGAPPVHGQGNPVHGPPPPGYGPPPQARMHSYPPPPQQELKPEVPALSEAEFEEIMARNRTVSSSAIARAVSDAAAGEYASAIETLVTAISLIKQSKTANDDRCKILISSLQDTLHGVETKSYGSSRRDRSRSRDRDRHNRRSRRDRSRSRERDYRDRSRDRDREKDRYYAENYGYRDRSRSREREREREYRERSREDRYNEDRYRERDREREREREREPSRREPDRERERDRDRDESSHSRSTRH